MIERYIVGKIQTPLHKQTNKLTNCHDTIFIKGKKNNSFAGGRFYKKSDFEDLEPKRLSFSGMIIRPGVAWADLQTAPSLID